MSRFKEGQRVRITATQIELAIHGCSGRSREIYTIDAVHSEESSWPINGVYTQTYHLEGSNNYHEGMLAPMQLYSQRRTNARPS